MEDDADVNVNGSGADHGHATASPHAAAAAAAGPGSDITAGDGEADHGVDDAIRSHTKASNPRPRALSADAPAFRPPSKPAPPPPPPVVPLPPYGPAQGFNPPPHGFALPPHGYDPPPPGIHYGPPLTTGFGPGDHGYLPVVQPLTTYPPWLSFYTMPVHHPNTTSGSGDAQTAQQRSQEQSQGVAAVAASSSNPPIFSSSSSLLQGGAWGGSHGDGDAGGRRGSSPSRPTDASAADDSLACTTPVRPSSSQFGGDGSKGSGSGGEGRRGSSPSRPTDASAADDSLACTTPVRPSSSQFGGDGSRSSGSGGERSRHQGASNTVTAASEVTRPQFHPLGKQDDLDPRELPLRRKFYREPTSVSSNIILGPPLMSASPSSGGSNSGKHKPSFLSVVKAKQGMADVNNEGIKWKTSMLQYLNDVDRVESYKQQASAAYLKLTVDFDDVLVKDTELAQHLCNNQGGCSFWLEETANSFFRSAGIQTSNAFIDFKNMPTRLCKARQFVGSSTVSKPVSFSSGKIVNSATAHGRGALDTILCGCLDRLAAGQSWCGTITDEDVWIAEYPKAGKRLLISKPVLIKENATESDRLDDLWSLWRAIVKSFIVNGQVLPLYFNRLQKDLFTATSFNALFVQYLRYHPALYTSMPRKNFIENVCAISKKSKVVLTRHFRMLFGSSPILGSDWRDAAMSDRIIYSVYTYKDRKEKERERKRQKAEEQEKQKDKGKKTEVEEKQKDKDKGQKEKELEKDIMKSKYENDVTSLLIFHRNGLQHPEDHPSINNVDEMELYLAATFEDFLPELIRNLLHFCNMDGDFVTAWSTYIACKSVAQGPPDI